MRRVPPSRGSRGARRLRIFCHIDFTTKHLRAAARLFFLCASPCRSCTAPLKLSPRPPRPAFSRFAVRGSRFAVRGSRFAAIWPDNFSGSFQALFRQAGNRGVFRLVAARRAHAFRDQTRAVGPANRTAGAFTGAAGPFIHTAGPSDRMAGALIGAAGAFSRTAGAASHTSKGSSHTNKPVIRTAGASSRTNNPASHANKWSSRAVFDKKHTKTA